MTTPNLPIGSELPQGVATHDELGTTLQDQSSGKYTDVVANRFPGVAASTPAGAPANPATPVGFVSDLFSTFTATVANADPSTINKPDDLVGLVPDFFENLPIIGEFVGFFEALGGTYDGDDPFLIDIQNFFAPIRQLLQNIGNDIADVENWFNNLGNSLFHLAAGVQAVNTAISLSGAQPVHMVGTDETADASANYQLCQDGIVVNSTQAIIGFNRIRKTDQRSVVTWEGYVSGTVTSLVFNLYEMDPATGDLNLQYTSPNQAGLLTANYGVYQFVLPDNVIQLVNYGDIYAMEAVVGGSGTFYWLGDIPARSPGSMPARPYLMGGFRNPTVLGTSPLQIPHTTMDNNYVKNVPWFTFGVKANPIESKRTISGFDPAMWLLAHSGSGADLILNGNQASYNGSSDGGEIGIHQTPLLTDNFDAAFTIKSGSVAFWSNLILASDYQGNAFLSLKVEAGALRIRNVWGGFYSGNFTDLYTQTISNTGTVNFYVTYRKPPTGAGTWNFYRGIDASGTPFYTCPDPSGFAHGIGHRFFGLMIEHAIIGPGAPITNFMAMDADV